MEISHYNSKHQYLTAISSYLKSVLEEQSQTKEQVTIAFSGGTSPIALLEHLSQIQDSWAINWQSFNLTLVDERLTIPTSANSNENLIKTHLINKLTGNVKFFGLVKPDGSSKAIQELNAIPAIDIAFLGMGTDGHIASLFLQNKEGNDIFKTCAPYVITTPQHAPYQRISLSLHALCQIPHLLLSIAGEEKLAVLNTAITTKDEQLPISHLLQKRNDIAIFYETSSN